MKALHKPFDAATERLDASLWQSFVYSGYRLDEKTCRLEGPDGKPLDAVSMLVWREANRRQQAHTAMVREGRALDNQERDMAHKQRVRDIYSQLAASEPDWVRIEAMDGSRRKTVEELVAEILPILEPLVAPVRRKALA